MATSHYCNGEWRDGPVESCSRHKRLSKKQTNVYKGVGEPGGRSKSAPPKSESSGKGTSGSSASSQSGGSGSGSSGESS